MNIMYCGDVNIQKGVWLSVMSITKHVSEPLKIYILTLDTVMNGKHYESVTDAFIEHLNEYIKKVNPESSAKKYDCTENFLRSIPEINLGTRFTPCCMLRLYADEIQDIPDRILYLDNDVLCRKDFTSFYNTYLDIFDYAGVLDWYGSHFYRRLILFKDYFNSGVLLFNMKKIRQDNLFGKCRDLCQKKKMLLPDQHALNFKTFMKKRMPRKYNDQRFKHPDTVFQHFSTTFRIFPKFRAVTVKPWDFDRVHSVMKITEYDPLFEEFKITYKD